DVTTSSDEDATFIFADDFEDESIGDPPSVDKWDVFGVGAVDFVDIQNRGGEQALRVEENENQFSTLARTKNFTPGFYSVTTYLDMDTIGHAYASQYFHTVWDVLPIATLRVSYMRALEYYNGYQYQPCGIDSLSLDTEYKIEIQVIDNLTIKLFVNGNSGTMGYRGTPTNGCRSFDPWYAYYGEDNRNYVAKTYVRKIVDPEPTHGDWGCEEPVVHDVAILSISRSKNIVSQGFPTRINVTSQNQGGCAETFNIILYANSTQINQMLVTLESGNSVTTTFIWDTAGFGHGDYGISAYATPLPYETDLDDNTYTDGMIRVTIPGDVNGDGNVNIVDLTIVAIAYGSFRGELDYNPDADIVENYVVDMQDLVIVARHLGEASP
ncbi:MAG: hypothetical protein JSV58_01310, partial [Candidatus Bathyarchaeota archaeon]